MVRHEWGRLSTHSPVPLGKIEASPLEPLLAVWLKAHADGSAHTRRAYERIGRRFVAASPRPGPI
jgi:hypothetical protein